MERKLQVFISSTYTDLIMERQAAVEAILTAGHIPAGMELFAAGDESQMEAIKRWIEESDVYLLILGGRYGSMEQHSGKSYTEVEYDYAVSINKPFFACVVSDDAQKERIKQDGSRVLERENPTLLTSFRQKVTSKMCRFWADTKDIKLSILETLSNFARREELIGWVRGNEPANAAALAEEVARLAKENTELRQQLSLFRNTDTSNSNEEYILVLNWNRKTRFRGFDLSKRDLSNLDFSGAEFINATLYGTNLENVRLLDANLTRANLKEANLQGANLTRANLKEANLQGADLRGARYNSQTNWPDGFDYGHSGAIGPKADLQDADLQGANLQDADLQCTDLQRANLQRANLQGAFLSGANLQDANLRGARYNSQTDWPNGFDYGHSGAIGPKADLQNADLQGANLQGADLRGANLQGADLRGADLQRANLQGADLQRVDLQGANLWDTDLQEAFLSGANLQDANLRGARYNSQTDWPDGFDYGHSRAIGPKADLQDADLQGANLQRANLQGAILQRANLQRANLQGANLQDADLQSVDLENANLQGAILQRANLQRANLQRANLQRANLQDADLRGAKLQADLQRADLQGANLQEATLQLALLQGADLRRANLQDADLGGADLRGARYNSQTDWPDEFDYGHSGAYWFY